MATAVGLNMKMTADTSGLGRGMTRAEKLLNGIGKNARSAARSLRVLATIQVGGALLKGLSSVSSAITGYVADVRQAAGAIQNFAQISNSSIAEFQRFAAAAGTVGIENEKLADIFKDVNDRIGDFLQTGGGPMADFFENVAPQVGVTVDQFRKLSGPQALQLYVKTLQDANLSQQEFTFYLEAMASDTTALIPLLKNGGEAFLEIADRAERLGIVLSEDQVGAIREMNGALTLVQKTFEGIIGQVTANLAPIVTEIAEEFLGFVEAFEGLNGAQGGNAIADFITQSVLNGIDGLLEIVRFVGNGFLTFADIVSKVLQTLAPFAGVDLRSEAQRRLDALESSVAAQAAAGPGGVPFVNPAVFAEIERLREQVAKEEEESAGINIRRFFNTAIDAAQDAAENVRQRLENRDRNATPPKEVAEPAGNFFGQLADRFIEGAQQRGNRLASFGKQLVDNVVNPWIEKTEELAKINEQIAAEEERAAEIEADRLDALSRRSTQALTVGDVRSGGISEVMRLATGREDPAIAESRKQLAQLQKIEQRIADLRADKVKIIGGAGRAA